MQIGTATSFRSSALVGSTPTRGTIHRSARGEIGRRPRLKIDEPTRDASSSLAGPTNYELSGNWWSCVCALIAGKPDDNSASHTISARSSVDQNTRLLPGLSAVRIGPGGPIISGDVAQSIERATHNRLVGGLIPPITTSFAVVAQLVELSPCKRAVARSIRGQRHQSSRGGRVSLCIRLQSGIRPAKIRPARPVLSGYSSAGRASVFDTECRRFDPCYPCPINGGRHPAVQDFRL